MTASPLTEIYDRWTVPSYERRIRVLPETKPPATPTYLWGSAGIASNITFAKPPILHIRNELFGDAVTIVTTAAGSNSTPIGTLQPGECVSIPLQGPVVKGTPQGITGVYATCPTETVVACLIRE
jgi:hypothetical protein